VCIRGVSNDIRTGFYSPFFDDTYKGSRLPVILDHCEKQVIARSPRQLPRDNRSRQLSCAPATALLRCQPREDACAAI
jgi:hypothetical protein